MVCIKPGNKPIPFRESGFGMYVWSGFGKKVKKGREMGIGTIQYLENAFSGIWDYGVKYDG